MSLNAAEIGLVVRALSGDLPGTIVRKIFSPATPDRIAIELRGLGENIYLQVVFSADGCRLGRIEKKPSAAKVPSPFVMLLRSKMVGAVVTSIEAPGHDRVVHVRLRGHDGEVALVCELTGRHANLFWLDPGGIIGGSFHPNRSSRRELVPGKTYEPPRPPDGAPRKASRFGEIPEGIDKKIEDHYSTLEFHGRLEARKISGKKRLSSALGRARRLVKNLETDKEKAERGEALQQTAYVLQANLYKIQRGMSRVEVTDFEGNEISIELDPRLDPSANMGRLFDRAKRLRKAAPKIDERLAKARAELAELEEIRARLEAAKEDNLDDVLERIDEVLPERAASVKGKKTQARRSPFKEYAVAFGRTARVGRSAADNDALTLRNSKPDDLWLHARGLPGSHVVVPMGRGEDPAPELLIDAAHLAAHFSEAKGDTDVEVTYTRRRYVQKPRGFPPGAVRLLKEKTVMLKVDEARLKRLLSQEG